MWCVCMCMYVCVYTIFPSIEKKTGKTTPEHKLAHTHTHTLTLCMVLHVRM